jgi:hypothetical protein
LTTLRAAISAAGDVGGDVAAFVLGHNPFCGSGLSNKDLSDIPCVMKTSMLKSTGEMRAELYKTGTMDELERLHIQVQIEALEAQKLAAAAIVKNSRYMLMSVVMATIATTITAAGLVFNIISLARVLR